MGGKIKYTYKTANTCCKEIVFDIEVNIIRNIEFLGRGCLGNLQAIPKLVIGMTVEEINEKLGNIKCGLKNTSCAKELAKAAKEACEHIILYV